MFKITNNNIEITRGDSATIQLKVSGHTFTTSDRLRFNIYTENGLTKTPVLTKTINATAGTSTNITLSSSDTTLGTLQNQAVTYWYDIVLNGNTTVVGFDEYGAKKFVVYPKGE